MFFGDVFLLCIRIFDNNALACHWSVFAFVPIQEHGFQSFLLNKCIAFVGFVGAYKHYPPCGPGLLPNGLLQKAVFDFDYSYNK